MSLLPWRTCSSCKKPIAHSAVYWVCSVSTCNRAKSPFAFCSVMCWDAHVPVMNHRNAWCEEKRAPREDAPADATADEPRRRIARPEPTPTAGESADDDILIVASRLKAYIDRRAGFNTSADVLPVLSDIVREATIDAIDRARADGRKTVKGRDFKASH